MNFTEEIADEIWKSVDFQNDIKSLFKANILEELRDNSLADSIETFDHEKSLRLLQSAMIFADTDILLYKEAAQRISTAIMRLLGKNDSSINDIFTVIQGRLKNFPLLLEDNKKFKAPKHAPLTIQLELMSSLLQQTITTRDNETRILTTFQHESWTALHDDSSLALTGPTSAGKSFVLLLYVLEKLQSKFGAVSVYLVPTKALINQVAEDMENLLRERKISNVVVSTFPIDIGQQHGKKTFYILTQERLEVLLINNPNLSIDFVIVDEAQKIDTGSRGILLESVLDRIFETSPTAQIVFCGPMISNPKYFGKVFHLKEFRECSTSQSPVTQNIIHLDYLDLPDGKVTVKLNHNEEMTEVANIFLSLSLKTDLDKISYLSLVFGRSGSSIVYASGKAEAEKVALKIAQELNDKSNIDPSVEELIAFVKKHVHKDYALAETLKNGVAFHYGHMPSLLRKELESCFKTRNLSYLVCTSTLLYGLNLPARNIFLLKPTTGRGTPISSPDFWNLAGRAGRLGKELEGNVYLIDYKEWPGQPLSGSREVTIKSALQKTLTDDVQKFLVFLDSPDLSSGAQPTLEIALGKLLLDDRKGRLEATIERYATHESISIMQKIIDRIKYISQNIALPTSIINSNIGVSVFRQIDLLNYFERRMKQISPIELIPAHPLNEFNDALNNLRRAFKRIHTYLLKYSSKDRRHYFFSGLSLRWMRGDPLPVLISSSIKHHEKSNPKKSKASVIRETMENVEKDLRFEYVKLFTCYNSLLKLAFERNNEENLIQFVPDIPLYLEMGGSSGAMINLMALGLSRTTSEALAEYITDKNISIQGLRKWILEQNFDVYDISPICLREIANLTKKWVAY